jgi:hypothetical protein
MLLALHAPSSPLRRSDLGCAAELRFSVAARERGAAEEAKASCCAARRERAAGSEPLKCGSSFWRPSGRRCI